MRDNPIKQALRAGHHVFGAMLFEFFSPGLPQLCRNAGAEFILYDMEHTGLGFETLKLQCALCRGLGIVPMVATREEAEAIVACTRYPPHGRRGADFGFAHDDYEGGEVAAKMSALHERTLVIAQVETTEGLANVEAIAAVAGVDALWIGHFDLTN